MWEMTFMGKCKFGNKASKGNISVLATTLLVIEVPILLWVLHNVIIKKIKDM